MVSVTVELRWPLSASSGLVKAAYTMAPFFRFRVRILHWKLAGKGTVSPVLVPSDTSLSAASLGISTGTVIRSPRAMAF